MCIRDRDYNRRVYENNRDYNRRVSENDRDYAQKVYDSDRNYHWRRNEKENAPSADGRRSFFHLSSRFTGRMYLKYCPGLK